MWLCVWTTQKYLVEMGAQIKAKLPSASAGTCRVGSSAYTFLSTLNSPYLLPSTILFSDYYLLLAMPFDRSAMSAHRECPEGGLSPVPTKVQARPGANPALSVI